MAIFRVQKTRDYTIMSNAHLKDKGLSLKAKGLLSVMLSLPDEWDYSIDGLVAISKENETAIKSTLKELKEHGYLEVIKLMPNQTESGRIEYVYNVYERPLEEKQEDKKQGVENLGVEILPVENRTQLITKESNTKKLNTKDVRDKFTSPTIDEVKEYCQTRNNNVNPERFVNFYEAKGWMIGKNKMKDWKAAVRTWENDNKPKTNGGFNQCMQNQYTHEEMSELEKQLLDN